MKAFFTVIFVALGIIFLSVTIFAGFKSLVLRAWENARNFFGGEKARQLREKGASVFCTPRASDGLMKVINITTGQCQCCGRTYIGTTADKEQPLKAVEFLGESRVLCGECLDRLKAEFNRSGASNEKKLSESARNLSELLASIRNQK